MQHNQRVNDRYHRVLHDNDTALVRNFRSSLGRSLSRCLMRTPRDAWTAIRETKDRKTRKKRDNAFRNRDKLLIALPTSIWSRAKITPT